MYGWRMLDNGENIRRKRIRLIFLVSISISMPISSEYLDDLTDFISKQQNFSNRDDFEMWDSPVGKRVFDG